ncbi:type I restriction endonuclease [Acinetobacter pittii]|uniref:type I restriction endonuclease n=1 Tax=Acinetobacter pittii TaxID=48296 RepID=UPI0032B59086
MALESTNFSFLAEYDPLFVELGEAAERVFYSDPNTTLIKLRQLGEAIAQHMAVTLGIEFNEQTTQADLIYKLSNELKLDKVVRDLFHTLRIEGNKATHQFKTKHKEAISGLIVARNLAIWFHRSFGKAGPDFKPEPFVPPVDPSQQLRDLQAEISELRNDLQKANVQLDSSQQLNDLIAKEKSEYEALALAMDEAAQKFAAQAKAHEDALAKQQREYEEKVKELQQQLSNQNEKEVSVKRQQIGRNARAASQSIVLDEKLTRILIDQQLQEAGWEADTQELDYRKGARPEKGRNMAIAEWPMKGNFKGQRADYVLFVGLTPIAVVEAKKENLNVAGAITQAERYSRGITIEAPLQGAWLLEGLSQPWSDGVDSFYRLCCIKPLKVKFS